jgi:hypothetical protein
VLLEVREVAPDRLVRGAKGSVVADTEQERPYAVDGEVRAVGAQAGDGLYPAPGLTSRGEEADA